MTEAPALNELIGPSSRALEAPFPGINGRQGGHASPRKSWYLTVFACQRWLNLPHHAHSFAAFVEVEKDEQGRRGMETSFVISWLPKSLEIGLFRWPEPGQILNLEQTLDWSLSLGAQATAWGPYEIKEELFRKARERYADLQTGITQFAVLDYWYRPIMATNCIHALSDLGLTKNVLATGFAYGRSASRKILRYYQPWILNQRTHPWVGDVLNLNRYPLSFCARA